MSAASTGKRRSAQALSRGGSPHDEAHDEAHVGHMERLTEDQLVRLLTLRPDLAEPPPRSLAELTERSQELTSVFQALREGDVLVLQLAQILTLIGREHVESDDVWRMIGDVPVSDVERGLNWLEDRHLLVREPSGRMCVHGGLLMIQNPAALGPPADSLVEALAVADIQFILRTLGETLKGTRKRDVATQLLGVVSDPRRVRDLVDASADSVKNDAGRMALSSPRIQLSASAGSNPYHSRRDTTIAAATWLLQRGLIYKDSWYTAVMPREVGLALRGGLPFSPDSYRRPEIAPQAVTVVGDSTGAKRAAKMIEVVERLVEVWGARPAALLKDGGVGVREVRRLAGSIDVPERETFRVIEIAAAAGLIVADTRQGLATATVAADEWSDLDAADRWWALALSWLETSMYPSLAGSSEGGTSKVVAALGYGINFTSDASGQRRGVLRAMRELAAGQCFGSEALLELASWDAPMLWHSVPTSPVRVVQWVVEEMELLGLAVDGAPTPLAAALSQTDPHGVRRLLGAVGEGSWQLIVQTDLTAVLSGRAPTALRAELDLLADVEGRDAATLYRISESSLRRAFDAGRNAEQILAFVGEHCAKSVPQTLTYLVTDVERRYGQVRLGPAGCYVRFAEPAVAIEVMRDKQLARLGLWSIAPTVLVSAQTHDEVLAALRSAGYLATAESREGVTILTAPVRQRVAVSQDVGGRATRQSTASSGSPARAVERWRSQVTGARAGESTDATFATDVVSLAATLRRTQGEVTSMPSARSTSNSMSGVELPTQVRRRVEGRDEPDSFTAELERLAEALVAEDGVLDKNDIAVIRDLLEMRGEFPFEGDDDYSLDEPTRPSDILRDRDQIADVLMAALREEWLVRMSYVSSAGKSSEVTVEILDVSDTTVRGQVAPRWSEQKYVLDRIGWVRVLTEAEEELVW